MFGQTLFDISSGSLLNTEQTQRYQQITQSEHYAASRLVLFNSLSGSINANGNLQIDLDALELEAECGVLEFKPQSSRFIDEQNYYYYGVLTNEDTTACLCWSGEVMLEAIEGQRFGYFTVGEFQYEISTIDNVFNVVSLLDTAYFSNKQECVPDSLFSEGIQQNNGGINRAGPACPIRVLFLYTQAAEDRFGLTGIQTMANLGISQTNQAFANSNITDVRAVNARIREWVGFDENPDNITGDIMELQTSAEVAVWRSSDLADVVCLITNAGYARLYGLSGIIPDPNDPDLFISNLGNPRFDLAYMIVEGEVFTTKMTFSHELGHIMGCRHQTCMTYQTDACDDDGDIEHGHGWGERPSWLCGWKNYSTILHQLRKNNTRLLHFSNPDVSHNDHPTGVPEDSNNAAWISDGNGCTVSEYMDEPVVNLSAIISGEAYICQPNTGQFYVTATGTGSPFSYEWQVSVDGINWGSVVGTSASISINSTNYSVNTTVFLRVKVIDATSATVFAFFNFEVRSGGSGCNMPLQYIPSAHVVWDIAPNPVKENLRISYEVAGQSAEVAFQINSISGAKLLQRNSTRARGRHTEEIAVDHLPSGLLFIQFWDGLLQHHKLLIKL